MIVKATKLALLFAFFYWQTFSLEAEAQAEGNTNANVGFYGVFDPPDTGNGDSDPETKEAIQEKSPSAADTGWIILEHTPTSKINTQSLLPQTGQQQTELFIMILGCSFILAGWLLLVRWKKTTKKRRKKI